MTAQVKNLRADKDLTMMWPLRDLMHEANVEFEDDPECLAIRRKQWLSVHITPHYMLK